MLLRGISKQFSRDTQSASGRAQVLREVSLELKRGEIYGFVGLNGAGKTTTIKIALGLTRPNTGQVEFFGRPAEAAAFTRIGFAPEKPVFAEFLTGEEILDYSARLLQIAVTAERKKVILEQVGLWGEQHKKVGAYSKGMQQRLALGAAMLHDPELLILDEPASGLDPLGRSVVKDLMRSLQKSGKTIFFSSHILADVSEICDRIGIIHQGKMLFEGSLDRFNPGQKDMEKQFISLIGASDTRNFT